MPYPLGIQATKVLSRDRVDSIAEVAYDLVGLEIGLEEVFVFDSKR